MMCYVHQPALETCDKYFSSFKKNLCRILVAPPCGRFCLTVTTTVHNIGYKKKKKKTNPYYTEKIVNFIVIHVCVYVFSNIHVDPTFFELYVFYCLQCRYSVTAKSNQCHYDPSYSIRIYEKSTNLYSSLKCVFKL